MRKAYTSNLTRDPFELIAPLLLPAKPGVCPQALCLWAVMNETFYLIKHGFCWRDLPSDFPAWPRVYTDYRTWVKDDTWDAIDGQLQDWICLSDGCPKSPSEVILDSHSVVTTSMVYRAIVFDAAKKTTGWKRHCMVDSLGLVIAVVVTAASVTERGEGKPVLQKLHQMGAIMIRIYLVWVDEGYCRFKFIQWTMDTLDWMVDVVLRPKKAMFWLKNAGLWSVPLAGCAGLEDGCRTMNNFPKMESVQEIVPDRAKNPDSSCPKLELTQKSEHSPRIMVQRLA